EASMDAKGWRKCQVATTLVNEAVGRVGERPLRLLSCALARLRWHKMEPDDRAAILAVERYLDGESGAEAPSSQGRSGVGRSGPAKLVTACQMHDARAAATLAVPAIRMNKDALLRLLRCLLGNPFVPLQIQPEWLSANDGAVAQLARAVAAG